MNPRTEGKQHLEKRLRQRHTDIGNINFGESLASPQELKFLAKNPDGPFGPPQAVGETFASEVADWEEVKDLYGCYVVLDPYFGSGVTFLSTREPLYWWNNELRNFPPKERLTAEDGFLIGNINDHLSGSVSPRAYLNEHGQAERGWRCPYLLKALYLMLYLDVTGGREIRKCRRSACQSYYRAGPQSNSKYCSETCANAASTRMGRGQNPKT